MATDKTRYKDVKVRMPKYLKREWAFFLGDCGRKKYNPLPSDKLLKGAQLICNKPFFRIFARLNIQNTDFVFVRHCNNSFFDDKNTAVSGDTAGGEKQRIWGIVPQSPMRMIFQNAHFCKVVFTDNALTIRLPFCIKRNCLNWQYFTNLTYVCENALTTEGDNVVMLS